MGYTATIQNDVGSETVAASTETTRYGGLYLEWKPSEKSALRETAAFFASVGVPTVYDESVGSSLDE